MNLQGKKVLVTGAGGFIGSHLAEELVRSGASVKAFVHYNSRNHWGWLDSSPLAGEMAIHSGDIRDFDSVRVAVREVEIIFHLAALIGIPYSYESPLAYVKTNIEGTYNILQAARDAGIPRVIQTSTSEVYGTARYAPIDEAHPLQPQSPYSASKIGADNLGLSYAYSFQLPVVIARPFNTFGPRQSARAIIPTIITQILAGKQQIRLGNLTPTRDLNYVQDTVRGFIHLALADSVIGQTVNIGSGREIAIGDLVKLIAGLMGVQVEVVAQEERVRRPGSEVERLLCNHEKIKQLTGWEPQFTLEAGLEQTIKWLKKNLSLYKPELYNV